MSVTLNMERPVNRVTPIVKRQVDGELVEVRRYGTTTNTVTYAGMAALFLDGGVSMPVLFRENSYQSSIFYNMAVGTGTTPITATSTALSNPVSDVYGSIASYKNIEMVDIGGVWHWRVVISYAFALGALVGNYTEFGVVSNSNGSGDLYTGGLFKDGSGDPVAVTVAGDEQLFIDYEYLYRATGNTQQWDGVDMGYLGIFYNYEPIHQEVVNIDGTNHTVTISRRRDRTRIDMAADRFEIYTRKLREVGLSEERGGVLYSGLSDNPETVLLYNDNSIGASLSVTPAPDLSSVTYSLYVFLSAISAFNDEFTDFYFNGDGVNSNSVNDSGLHLNVDPPLTLGAGKIFEVNLDFTLNWS